MSPPRRRRRFPWQPFLGAVYMLTVAVALGILISHWMLEPGEAPPPATPGTGTEQAAPPVRGAFSAAPAWRRFAAAIPAARDREARAGAPLVAIVLDDAGVNRVNTRRALAMKAPLTFAFLPYAPNLAPLVARARANGHEVLVHLPMEPLNAADHDAGPNALTVGLSDRELRRRLSWNLNRFQGYVGVNNHMGSRFSADAAMMTKVLRELKSRGLLFLDSRTTPATVGETLARDLGLPTTSRDLFLDNEVSAANIAGQLARLRRVAARKGSAIAIGHPHERTLEALEAWVEEIETEGFVLAPVSAVVARRMSARAGARYAGR